MNQMPSNNEVKEIAALAELQLFRARRVSEIEEELKQWQAALRQTQEVDLPNAMQQAGVSEIKLPTGEKITIKDGITASVPKDRKAEVCAWLRLHGFGDIVSEDVSVSFGRGEEAQARETADRLRELGLQPALVTDVNTARLKALITEQLAKGKDVPLEMFGAIQWTKAVIK